MFSFQLLAKLGAWLKVNQFLCFHGILVMVGWLTPFGKFVDSYICIWPHCVKIDKIFGITVIVKFYYRHHVSVLFISCDNIFSVLIHSFSLSLFPSFHHSLCFTFFLNWSLFSYIFPFLSPSLSLTLALLL